LARSRAQAPRLVGRVVASRVAIFVASWIAIRAAIFVVSWVQILALDRLGAAAYIPP
jgi:hypothetical protein